MSNLHILCITLTGKQNQGARAIQMAKVVKALQDQGAFVTIITCLNDKLYAFNPNAGRIIYIDPAKSTHSKAKRWALISKIAGQAFPQLDLITRLAVVKALEVVETEKPDCIFSSSNPVSSHIAALKVAQITGLPWLASFSDPKPSTMLPPPYGNLFKRLLPKGYKTGLKKVLQNCDAVHMPTSICLDITEKYYRVSLVGKSFSIPPIGETTFRTEKNEGNGYLVHLGSTTKRLSKAFLLALSDFVRKNPKNFQAIQFIGKRQKKTESLIKQYGLGSIVLAKPQVPHHEAQKIVSNATAVLILEADMPYSHALPSKFAEAAFSGTPILAVTPAKSAISEYLNTYGGGIAVANSREDIVKGLDAIFGQDSIDRDKIAAQQVALSNNFTFNEIGQQYIRVFNMIIGDIKKYD